MAYKPGYARAVTFQLDGAMGATTIKVTATSWDEHIEPLISTHTGSGGIQERLAGILDGEGDVQANVDGAALPNAAAPGIVAGAKGTLTYDVGGTTPFTIHVLIQKVHWASVVNGLMTYSFHALLDNTSGTYTRPT